MPLIVLILFIMTNLFSKKKSIEIRDTKSKFSLIVLSFLTFFFWLAMFPMSKYGGYSYILFFFYIISYFIFKKLFLSILFFVFKNSNRIYNEIFFDAKNKIDVDFINKDFPIPHFITMKFHEVSNQVINFNVSSDPFSCFDIDQICVPNIAKDTVKFKKVNNYIHVYADENKILSNNQKALVYTFSEQQKKNKVFSNIFFSNI